MPKRELQGVVTSDKPPTRPWWSSVDRRFRHPLYKKIVRRSKKFMAHDEANNCKVGDIVTHPRVPTAFQAQDLLEGSFRRSTRAQVIEGPER